MDIKPLWKDHPLFLEGKIELVPTEWVWQYRGVDVSPLGDLMDGSLVTVEALWEDLCREGLHEPLIMRVGIRNKMMRLESGNHRIQLFHRYGIAEIPVVAEVREECGPDAPDIMTDATHNFDASNELLIESSDQRYRKPSEVFRSLSTLERARV